MTPELVEEEYYEEEGFVQDSVMAIIYLIIGVGVAALVLIFVGVLGGQTFSLVESDINAINNSTIAGYIKDGIVSSFLAVKQTGSYLPILVLAVIITVILTLIMGMSSRMTVGAYGYGYGGTL